MYVTTGICSTSDRKRLAASISLLVPARVLDRGADDLAERPPVLHPAGCELGARCAVDLDHADRAVGRGEREDEEGGRPQRPARADDRELRRVVGERPLGPAPAQRDEPPRAVVQEPDPGLAAGQLGSMGRERPRDLVELERRREVTGKLEQGLLTAGGRHLALPIGRAAAVLERMPASERRGAPEAPKHGRPARSPSARRGTSGRWEACGGSSRRSRNRRSGSPRAPRAPRTSCRSQRRLQCSSHDPRVELLPSTASLAAGRPAALPRTGGSALPHSLLGGLVVGVRPGGVVGDVDDAVHLRDHLEDRDSMP